METKNVIGSSQADLNGSNTKAAGSSSSASKAKEPSTVFRSIFAPTVPTSAPFVYHPDVKPPPRNIGTYNTVMDLHTPAVGSKSVPGTPLLDKQDTEGQAKASTNGPSSEHSGTPATKHIREALSFLPPMSTFAKRPRRKAVVPDPPKTQTPSQKYQPQMQTPAAHAAQVSQHTLPPSMMPYPYPPHPQYGQPAHPYYMPIPYGMPPYGVPLPPPNTASTSANGQQAPSSDPQKQHPYSYPYPPHMYGYPPYAPPPGYPYMPQGYLPGTYGQPPPPGQQESSITPVQHLQPGTYPPTYGYGKETNFAYYHPPPATAAQVEVYVSSSGFQSEADFELA